MRLLPEILPRFLEDFFPEELLKILPEILQGFLEKFFQVFLLENLVFPGFSPGIYIEGSLGMFFRSFSRVFCRISPADIAGISPVFPSMISPTASLEISLSSSRHCIPSSSLGISTVVSPYILAGVPAEKCSRCCFVILPEVAPRTSQE